LFAHKIRKEKKMGRILTAIFRRNKKIRKKNSIDQLLFIQDF
jgi:hypothetical protein